MEKSFECDDAISREDAIKAQCEACDICGNMRYTKCQYFMQGCNEVKCLRDLPPVTQKSGKWIPVSERLPEEFESVLVCYKSQGGMAQAVSERFGTHTGYKWSALAGIKPIAWMPLPKPYEPQEREDKE